MPKSKFRKYLEDVIAVKDWRGVTADDLINDPTYDYELFYNKQPAIAAAILKQDKNAHFTDIGKTSLHPTFSDESYYSGWRNSRNPRGIIGGRWGPNRYTLSKSQVNNDWDILDTIEYLNDAEDKGVQLRLPNGSLPYINEGYFGGVLPVVDVYSKKSKKRK